MRPLTFNVAFGILAGLTAVLSGARLNPISTALAHGGQIEVGGGEKGPVHLSDAQQKAIALQMAVADFRPLDDLLYLNGEVRLQPGHQAEVSTRISGQVTQVFATIGDTVKLGQRLARVQSRLVGDPPPSVDVLAPMSGIIDTLGVAIGQSVEPTTVLFRISDRSQVIDVARVYEEDLGKIKVGQETRVRTLSYPDRLFTGKVTLVGPTLDPQSRTVEVWIALANPEGLLKPNLFARASVILKQNSAALAIPNTALIEANGEKFVFVHQKNEFVRVEITTGPGDDQFTEVTDGLVPGDEVVTQGSRQIYTLWLTGGGEKPDDKKDAPSADKKSGAKPQGGG